MKTDRKTLKEVALDRIKFRACGQKWMTRNQMEQLRRLLTESLPNIYDVFAQFGESEVATAIYHHLKDHPEMATIRELARHYSLRDFLATLRRKEFKVL